MPLIALATVAYAAGLLAGFSRWGIVAALIAGAVAAGAVALGRSRIAIVAVIVLIGSAVADGPFPPRASVPASGPLAAWRARAGQSIDALFGGDAPVVRALLIADTRDIPPDVRDRFARAGLVHVLSISGMHVAIIAGAVLIAFQAFRLSPHAARWCAVAVTGAYVLAIGAPPPALRSGVMLAGATASWALQRPVSPWATLALGALVPLLVNPRTVLDLGYQLSVAGFAALIAGGILAKRVVPRGLGGFRRTLATDLVVSTVASFASAPLVAWHFARVSLIAPFANVVAAPVVAVMQPALFLALLVGPDAPGASIISGGAQALVRALDRIAAVASALPWAAVTVAPSLSVAALAALATTLALVAAARPRDGGRWAVAAAGCVACVVWLPTATPRARGMELHVIDVGQGDAIAVRTPAGRWIVVDAGGGRATSDAGRRILLPYLRRAGGDVALFVMTHPHEDHVGGAPTLIRTLRPGEVRDAAFAGTSTAYREALAAARERGTPWRRIHPGDSVVVDGVVATFLAPDSAWTAGLRDPNLASAIVLVRFGQIRALLTGDAEAAEEAWLVARSGERLRAQILKVAHHGSATSTTGQLVRVVRPELAIISVGRRNRYGHPSPAVLDTLRAAGVVVARTDLAGSIVVRTDAAGTRYDVTTSGARSTRGPGAGGGARRR